MTSIRAAVHRYLNLSEPFTMFGAEHLIGILVSLVLWIVIPLGARNYLTERWQQRVGSLIGYLVMSNYLVWVLLELVAGSFSIQQHLPFQLCRFANLTLPLVMARRSYRMYEILYFWGFSGILQAAITPDIVQGFPHFHYFRFWIGHNGLVLALVYATVVYGLRPTGKSLWRSFFALNLFFITAIPVNLVLKANYFWICGKPAIPSLLDYMGPWPWYILSGEGVALVHFALAYAPLYFLNKSAKRRTSSGNRLINPPPGGNQPDRPISGGECEG